MTTEVERLKQQLAEAQRNADAATLSTVCTECGAGVRDVLSRNRDAKLVAIRHAVVWILRRKLRWPEKRVAQSMGLSVRSIRKMAVSSSTDRN